MEAISWWVEKTKDLKRKTQSEILKAKGMERIASSVSQRHRSVTGFESAHAECFKHGDGTAQTRATR
jgi:hypothetical protein